MKAGTAVLIVRGFAVPEGRNKWACCYEIRLDSGCDQPLLYRGELHGRAFVSEHAAVVAAREAGELEARRRIEAGLATACTSQDVASRGNGTVVEGAAMPPSPSAR